MKRLQVAVLALLTLTGCERSVTVTGTLEEDTDIESVWHFAGEASSAVRADSFHLAGLRGAELDLRFTSEDGAHARMHLSDVDGGSRIHLGDVWIDDDVAYPSYVEIEDGGLLVVNGIRMGDRRALPGDLRVRAVILAAGRSNDAFLARPLDEALADLRVVITPATEVVSPDGDPVRASSAEVGDTVVIAGATESGYLVASRIELGRR